MKESKN